MVTEEADFLFDESWDEVQGRIPRPFVQIHQPWSDGIRGRDGGVVTTTDGWKRQRTELRHGSTQCPSDIAVAIRVQCGPDVRHHSQCRRRCKDRDPIRIHGVQESLNSLGEFKTNCSAKGGREDLLPSQARPYVTVPTPSHLLTSAARPIMPLCSMDFAKVR